MQCRPPVVKEHHWVLQHQHGRYGIWAVSFWMLSSEFARSCTGWQIACKCPEAEGDQYFSEFGIFWPRLHAIRYSVLHETMVKIHVIYFFPVLNFLKFEIAFFYGWIFSYRPPLAQKVTASGFVLSSSWGSESMDSDKACRDDDDIAMYNCSGSISNSRLGRFVFMDSFSNE